MATEVRLPELGEGVERADVVRVLVAPGDTVAVDQPLLEIETDKATVEVPSPVAGTVAAVAVEAGATLAVGGLIASLEPNGAATDAPAAEDATATDEPAAATDATAATAADLAPNPGAAPARSPAADTPPPAAPAPAGGPSAPGQTADAAPSPPPAAPAGGPSAPGQAADAAPSPPPAAPAGGPSAPGQAADAAPSPPPAAPTAPEPPPAAVPVSSPSPPAAPASVAAAPYPGPAAPAPTSRRRALAAPSVRKLAREIGVDIDAVEGSRANGRVSLDDVKAHARRAMERLRSPAQAPAQPSAQPSVPALPDFSRWGPVERTPMRNVRRAVARRMSTSWQTVPHVTQHDRADISEFEAVRRTLKRTSPGLPLTATAFAVAVVAAALKEFPQFNASLDTARDEIVYKRYINIGVAVDTERGLIVPVIPQADGKSLAALSTEIAEVATLVRTTGAPRERLEGGTFTITNLGGLGGTAFTPIVNYPEVAILGMSRSAPAPVWANGRFEPRSMLPLSLSYDHRLIDGADAVRFLRWVAERLEHPLLLELQPPVV